MDSNADARLDRQLSFIGQLDRLKGVVRMTSLMDGSRRENSAEHSWHLAVMAPLLAEHAPDAVDVSRVVMMLAIHDVVEIDAGDTFAFDKTANLDKEERERAAADHLYGLLPEDQGSALRRLWDEFEEGQTPDARFAVALDRFQGLLQNYANGGGTWFEHGVTRERVLERMAPIEKGAPGLWAIVLRVLDEVMASD
ncbi:MAG: HD domain-containing protein [Gemmatimonadota bacterium]